MKLLQVTEQNKPYYSADYTKGFNDGAKTQYEADKKDAERRGRWIEIRNVAFPHLLCSECKKPFYGSYSDAWNYCPNCGARMVSEDDS